MTQFEDEGMLAVYGSVPIATESGGWVYEVVTPLVTYTPGNSWLSESHISKVPFVAEFGHTYGMPTRSRRL